MGKFNFTKANKLDSFKPDAITSLKSGQQITAPMGEGYYDYFTKVHNDAVKDGKMLQLDEDNPILNLAYEGHGLKKFKGKFNFTPTHAGVIKSDYIKGQNA